MTYFLVNFAFSLFNQGLDLFHGHWPARIDRALRIGFFLLFLRRLFRFSGLGFESQFGFGFGLGLGPTLFLGFFRFLFLFPGGFGYPFFTLGLDTCQPLVFLGIVFLPTPRDICDEFFGLGLKIAYLFRQFSQELIDFDTNGFILDHDRLFQSFIHTIEKRPFLFKRIRGSLVAGLGAEFTVSHPIIDKVDVATVHGIVDPRLPGSCNQFLIVAPVGFTKLVGLGAIAGICFCALIDSPVGPIVRIAGLSRPFLSDKKGYLPERVARPTMLVRPTVDHGFSETAFQHRKALLPFQDMQQFEPGPPCIAPAPHAENKEIKGVAPLMRE